MTVTDQRSRKRRGYHLLAAVFVDGDRMSKQPNQKGLEQACEELNERLAMELRNNPGFHGSIAVTVQILGGVVDRFRITSENNIKCEAPA